MKMFIGNTSFRVFKTSSIKSKIKISYMVIIAVVLIPLIMSITFSTVLTYRYGQLIDNVNNAKNLNQIVNTRISNEIWDIVSGKKDFKTADQYRIIQSIYEKIDILSEDASTKGNQRLIQVARRTVSTLEKYVDMLGRQIENNAEVQENEKLFEEIRDVAGLVNDIIQEFILSEIDAIARVNDSLQRLGFIIGITEILLFVLATVFAVYTFTSVAENISAPILKLKNLSVQIAKGDLEARVEPIDVDELKELAHSLNVMAERIRQLIDENRRELISLQKSEMRVLQAQIMPHFLYNTFDTIIWLAESGKTGEVVNVAMAFSNFFRISLSKGKDWITVGQEVEHVKNYLTIQRVRYESILDYKIEVEEALLNLSMPKLLLQPLVENALYHGIKFRRNRGGLITLKGWLENNEICFWVEDNGIGIPPDRLEQIRESLEKEEKIEGIGYGIYNVNKRLQLYYETNKSLEIDSRTGQGTCVSFRLPYRSEHKNV